MPEFLQNAGRELPLILLLLALLGFRRPVTPRVSLPIGAPAEKIFELLDLREGDSQRWQRTRVNCTLVDPAERIYRLRFVTPLFTGAVHSSEALFRLSRREAPHFLEIDRAGLDGQSSNSQLLRMRAELAPEGEATRLTLTYWWGPRPLLAQLLARTDLWGSAFRLKGAAETGVPDFRSDLLLSAAVALATGVLTLATFALAFGWAFAGLLVGALFVHEAGHLIAYRLIGQPWGRLVFLPFLGAIAVPRLALATQGQSVFSALMGPGFSVILPLAAAGLAWSGADHHMVVLTGIVAAGLNLFNLLPVEPLDGGVALRSILARLMGEKARFGLIGVGLAIVAAGFVLEVALLMVFGGLAVVANLRRRAIDPGLQPLSSLQTTISAFGFMSVVTAYSLLLHYLLSRTSAFA